MKKVMMIVLALSLIGCGQTQEEKEMEQYENFLNLVSMKALDDEIEYVDFCIANHPQFGNINQLVDLSVSDLYNGREKTLMYVQLHSKRKKELVEIMERPQFIDYTYIQLFQYLRDEHPDLKYTFMGSVLSDMLPDLSD